MKEIRVVLDEDIDEDELHSLAEDIHQAITTGTLGDYLVAVEKVFAEDISFDYESEEPKDESELPQLEEPIKQKRSTCIGKGWNSGYLDGGWTV